MKTERTISSLRAQIHAWQQQGKSIAFVPTMGNLHDGHLALITLAKQHADRIVTSIFVNPTQFAPHEDFAKYPRTLETDQCKLHQSGCDLLFLPDTQSLYPLGVENTVYIEVPHLSSILCGASRPGHFAGVATVITRLFNIVQPNVAIFGQKDFQQVRIIQHLINDLNFPIRIITAPIVRDATGLALSSRNQYLTTEEKSTATEIYRTLQYMQTCFNKNISLAEIEHQAQQRLITKGFLIDYITIRQQSDLQTPNPHEKNALVALIAVRLRNTRLIDNILL